MILDIVIHGLQWASIYATVAIGFSLIFSASKIINLAQGEFVMFGGLVGFSLYSLNLPLFLVPFLSAIIVSLIGVLIERAALSPAKKASPTSLIIITIAVSLILRSAAALIWGPYTLRIPSFFTNLSAPRRILLFNSDYALIIFSCFLSILVLGVFLRKTKMGRIIRACSMDPQGARIVGVSPEKMRMLSFSISAGLGGMMGTLIAPVFYANSDLGLNLGIKGFCAAVLGGMGSIPGAIVGGLVIGISEATGACFASSYKDIIAPLLMLFVLYLKPQGILGGRT